MEYYYRPKVVTFKGEEAKEILVAYIKELEGKTPEELTEAQTKTMIKIAEGLISAIEAEPQTQGTPRQQTFLPTIVEAIKGIFQSEQNPIPKGFVKANTINNPHHHA